jgi:hypothetical protein
MIDLLTPSPWQMTFGERAALEGVLAELRPSLAIEIGTAEGGSLRRIATHSGEVHSFDLVEPAPEIRELANVTLHTGDSHVLLAEFLSELEKAGRDVDFALVDGDHTAEGVRVDMETLLCSPALARCVILMHDTANDIVRAGLESVDYDGASNVVYRDLDFVGGHLSRGGDYANQLWGGIGVVVVDRDAKPGSSRPRDDFYPSFEIFAAARDGVVAAGAGGPREAVAAAAAREQALRQELSHTHATLDSLAGSISWRGTAPLRAVMASIRTRRG